MSTQQPPTKKIKMFSSESLVNAIPVEIWRDVICTKLGYFDRSNVNATCNEFNDTFENYNQKFLKKHAIHVPQDAPTIEKAMELVAKLQLVPTEKDPLRIVLDKGVHEITESNYVPDYVPDSDSEDDEEEEGCHDKTVLVPCSHITFVGKGKDQTTIRGGFFVRNQQNVKFEEITVMNPSGCGFEIGQDGRHFYAPSVEMLNCIVKKCIYSGLGVSDGATVTATQCDFMENGGRGVLCYNTYNTGRYTSTKAILNDCKMHHNGMEGLCIDERAVVDLHGTKTDIHSNKKHGIIATNRAKINIHLPSQHSTSHDNVGEDRQQQGGGGEYFRDGSIANINADGTFTHVVADDEVD